MPSIHSDILVHWTGKTGDIGPLQRGDDGKVLKNEYNRNVEDAYLQRLLDILRYGFWMTDQPFVAPTGFTVDIPQAPGLCFTELKLSESEAHAEHYGWLGIGVKRPFVFERGGRPVIYWGFNQDSPRDIFLDDSLKEFEEKREKHWRMHFFKPMNSKKKPDSTKCRLDYDYYSESEWRIIFNRELSEEESNGVGVPLVMSRKTPPEVKSQLENDPALKKYVDRLSKKKRDMLQGLVPVDGWLAMIIYPSVGVKNRAQRCPKIRDEIRRIKMNLLDHANRVEGGNWPVELDFDLCSHL